MHLVQMISKEERNSGCGNEHGVQNEARTPKPMRSCYKQARDLSLLASSHQLGKTISYALYNICKYETIQKKPSSSHEESNGDIGCVPRGWFLGW